MTEQKTPILHPCVSLDLETSGLDVHEDQVFQIGMVLETGDLNTPPMSLPRVNFIVKPNLNKVMGNAYALWLNSKLLGAIAGTVNIEHEFPGAQIIEEDRVPSKINSVIEEFKSILAGRAASFPDGKPQILAKNGEKLDIPMLNNCGGHNWFKPLISHRSLDVGSLWAPFYGTNVSLKVINKDLGLGDVTHDALKDALDNIVALRAAFKRFHNL